MIPRIAIFPETKVIGMRMTMSYSDDKARELWKRFMPRRKEVLNNHWHGLLLDAIVQSHSLR
jgi:AraC family transcriptional regulator